MEGKKREVHCRQREQNRCSGSTNQLQAVGSPQAGTTLNLHTDPLGKCNSTDLGANSTGGFRAVEEFRPRLTLPACTRAK